MAPETEDDFLDIQRRHLNNVSDALNQLIDETLPADAREIDQRFEARDKSFHNHEVSFREALLRLRQHQDLQLMKLTDKVSLLQANLKKTRSSLAHHYNQCHPHNRVHVPLGPNETESKQFPNPAFPH